jgi:hypothetical protein
LIIKLFGKRLAGYFIIPGSFIKFTYFFILFMTKAHYLGDRFHPQGVYPCPVCRHGEITAMPLMETFACSFCQHIFSTNLDKQLIKMVDSQLPLTWYWSGKSWKGIEREGVEFGWSYLILSLAFVLIPTGIVSLSVYLFPPMPESPLSWLPFIWMGLTFLSHLTCLVWLVLEYYQFPIGLYVRALKRRLFVSE